MATPEQQAALDLAKLTQAAYWPKHHDTIVETAGIPIDLIRRAACEDARLDRPANASVMSELLERDT